MNNFQTISVAIFLAFFVFAVLIFSGMIDVGSSKSDTKLQGKIIVWGIFKTPEMSKVIQIANDLNPELTISYIQKDPTTYEDSLINAFAKNEGPDLFFMIPSMIKKFDTFVYKIPYANYPEKVFRDSFIEGADIYLSKDGIIGYPVIVDPLVMYYNKNIFSSEAIATPPQYWSDLFDLSSILTKKEDNGSIINSMIALGRYENVNNAKDILATLFIQNNNNIIERTETSYESVLGSNNSTSSTVELALKFFVEFSNPANTAYSWNRALPSSIDMFTSGRLAMYLGRASELFKIESVNPNLSFDVVQMLQTKGTNTKRTYGDIYAIAINKKSANVSPAFGFASLLSQEESAKELAANLSLPPVLKSLLNDKPKTNPYLYEFFNSAIISRSWIDPSKTKSDLIFSELIQNITSNKLSVGEAINKAQGQLDQAVID